ncbi:putative MPP superfamily phosphohydrolase [Rhizobium leguminosarum]|nr:calcineurin-like phosphoesterase superfamily domain protein [Rhizobium leguminosarum bv. viciae]MBB4327079.1 putative MPP superfamily phosphohydrolase [Rhizobium leguminosarum]MDH6662979.1 putative MPP superfamily phosphohydrolase [Rhizobium sophorae]MBB4341336.1 putative MPP superfamily phosphohydrolase [Rhizobium leguminosarum]MBB4352744.1 putative MPP superfamily phosphohydrolase [Rhizobium leguminosarum]
MKIIQITDTHFSPDKPHFNGNWAPLLTWIEETGADLIVHTGDLTVDGADKDADITFSMDLMRRVSIPMLIVPGNHMRPPQGIGPARQCRAALPLAQPCRRRPLAGGCGRLAVHRVELIASRS